MRISRFPCLAETLKEGCVFNEELPSQRLACWYEDMVYWCFWTGNSRLGTGPIQHWNRWWLASDNVKWLKSNHCSRSRSNHSGWELWEKIKLLFIVFPTSYLVERGFSSVTMLLAKQRNKLRFTGHGDLHLPLTNLKPDVDKLVFSHQVHPFHLGRVNNLLVYDYSIVYLYLIPQCVYFFFTKYSQ